MYANITKKLSHSSPFFCFQFYLIWIAILFFPDNDNNEGISELLAMYMYIWLFYLQMHQVSRLECLCTPTELLIKICFKITLRTTQKISMEEINQKKQLLSFNFLLPFTQSKVITLHHNMRNDIVLLMTIGIYY